MGTDVQGSLREALYETLTGILSPHQETRQPAEQRLQALEVTEEFGIHLTEFLVDPNRHLPIRQLASVLLKQYVETHWCTVAEKFRPPEIKPAAKEKIKELLPMGLRDSISKVRTAVAYAISTIAHWDWPENWPGLFDILVSCLSGECEFAVHGAMRVLTEFTRDLADTQISTVGPIILQEMYRIFQCEYYSIRTRSRAVEIFTTIASLIATTSSSKAFTQVLQPVIPTFCDKFVQCLRLPDGLTVDSGLKTEVIKAINCLVVNFPEKTANFVSQMFAPIWEILTQNTRASQEGTVIRNGDSSDEEVDSDGKIINFNNLIIAIFEFMHSIVSELREPYPHIVEDILQEAIYYLIIFMQITEDQIELWTISPNEFVDEGYKNVFAYNIRIAAQELLSAILNRYPDRAVNMLCEVVTRNVEVTNRLRSSNEGNEDRDAWWKLREASVLALSIAKEQVEMTQQRGLLQFDIVRFLDTVVLATLNDPSAPPPLLGRCLCLGGRYASIMPSETSSRFLEATVNGLQEQQPVCIRISAVKAIHWFREVVTTNEGDALRNIIGSHLPNIFQGLFSLISQSSTEVLISVMETYEALVSLDEAFIASVENKICPLTIAVFLKFYSNPMILDLCKDIFKTLTQNPNCTEPLQSRLVPTLTSMMTASPVDKTKDEAYRGVALDVLRILVQYCPKNLNSTLIQTPFTAACHSILNSEDSGILQSGGELIRVYLSAAGDEVIDRDYEGQTGLQYILQIIAHLLSPQLSEFTAISVGRLVITLIRKARNRLGENLDLLLKAVLSKMQRAETLSVMQSLLMIYAHLINTEFDAVLNFLATVPGPTGESALSFVLSEWVSKQQFFFGRYQRKMATLAICKILEYGVTHDDNRLNEITVQGEQIFPENEQGVRTRSKTEAQPYQWTTVPLLVKIFKLLISEVKNDMEDMSDNEDETDSEDDDDRGSYTDLGNEVILDQKCVEEWNVDEDPDMRWDSIELLDIHQYLPDFLLNFSTHHCFPTYARYLTPIEQKVLNSLDINTTFM